MTIAESTTVADVVTALPSSVRVFQRHGIDFCCGGRTPLGVACREQNVPFEAIAAAIQAAAAEASPDARNWNDEPLCALIDHIVATYHDTLRDLGIDIVSIA